MAYPNSIEAIFAQFAEQFCATMATVVQEVMQQTRHSPYTEQHTDNQLKNHAHPKSNRNVFICGYNQDEDCLCVTTDDIWSGYHDNSICDDVVLAFNDEGTSTADKQRVRSFIDSNQRSVTKDAQQVFDKSPKQNDDRVIPEVGDHEKLLAKIEDPSLPVTQVCNELIHDKVISVPHSDFSSLSLSTNTAIGTICANKKGFLVADKMFDIMPERIGYIVTHNPDPPDDYATPSNKSLVGLDISNDNVENSYNKDTEGGAEFQVFAKRSQRNLCCYSCLEGGDCNYSNNVACLKYFGKLEAIVMDSSLSLIDVGVKFDKLHTRTNVSIGHAVVPCEGILVAAYAKEFSTIYGDMKSSVKSRLYENGAFPIKLWSLNFPQPPPKGYFIVFKPNITINGEIYVNTLNSDEDLSLGLYVLGVVRLMIEPFLNSIMKEQGTIADVALSSPLGPSTSIVLMFQVERLAKFKESYGNLEKAVRNFCEFLKPPDPKIYFSRHLHSFTTFSNNKKGILFQYDTNSMVCVKLWGSVSVSSEGYSSANFGDFIKFYLGEILSFGLYGELGAMKLHKYEEEVPIYVLGYNMNLVEGGMLIIAVSTTNQEFSSLYLDSI